MKPAPGLPRSFLLYLVLAAGGLWAATVPGLFTVDESNYLASSAALRKGGLLLPGYEGLTPSIEMNFFEPGGPAIVAPPDNRLPPLYAVLALPFSLFGVRGLFAMNLLAFLLTASMTFQYVRRVSDSGRAAWLAAALFALGSYTLEYALGMWPHMVSIALTTGAFVLAARDRAAPSNTSLVMAGVLVGLASGVRYQNIVLGAAMGLGVLLLHRTTLRGRLAAGLRFACGAALPLTLTSLLNYLRSGSAVPISKGPGYLSWGNSEGSVFADSLLSLAYRTLDFRLRPPAFYSSFAEVPNADSGAYLWFDTAKKAWLQSSPWVGVVLLGLLLALLPLGRRKPPRAQELRALGLLVWAMLALFALAGSARTDGFCFNQRYLLELTPLAAMALPLLLRDQGPPPLGVLVGSMFGVAFASMVLMNSVGPEHHTWVLRTPLWIGGAVVAVWLLQHLWPSPMLVALVIGTALGWGLTVHVTEDVAKSRWRRQELHKATQSMRGRIADGAAVFVWTAYRNAASPLLLEQDLTIFDASRDRGKDTPKLMAELLAQNRRVFVIMNNYDRPTLEALVQHYPVTHIVRGHTAILELRKH